jgi:hypothetical protein
VFPGCAPAGRDHRGYVHASLRQCMRAARPSLSRCESA